MWILQTLGWNARQLDSIRINKNKPPARRIISAGLNFQSMTTEQLKQQITANYPTRRAFIVAFNDAAGFAALNESILSRQLSGRVALSIGWQAAYTLFCGREK